MATAIATNATPQATNVGEARIRAERLGKCYRLYARPADRLLEGCRTAAGRLLRVDFAPVAQTCWALRDVSLEVCAGESVAIIGRNGSGKSTLLQLVAGTLTPSEGSVQATGRVCALLELGAGFHPEFTGLENIRTYATVLGLTPAELREQFAAIVAFADIGDYIGQPVKTYSSGMYLRLAFAVAMHAAPQILIVDEALAVGDIAFQARCMARIRRFQESGGILLLVSHDVAAARALCQRAIYLERGQIKAAGPAGPAVDRYLRDMHEAVNSDVQAVSGEETAPIQPLGTHLTPSTLSARFAQFEAGLVGSRQGTGEARIRLAEMVDAAERPIDVAEFDSAAKIRLWVECQRECRVSVNYKIRDRHLVSVAGADLLITGHGEVSLGAGELYLVEYETRLPLMAGDYTLRLSITQPIARHEQAVFVDIIEVTFPFRVLPSTLGRIYTSVYLHNAVTTTRVLSDDAS